MTRASRPAIALAAVALGLVLSSCDGVPTAKGDEVAETVTNQLKAEGKSADKVSCPQLKGDKGKKVTCSVTKSGKKYDVVVTARGFRKNSVTTSVDTSKVPKS